MDINQQIANILLAVKEKKPLVHHITNYLTVNDCANIVLALGGSPVMADDLQEVEDMVGIASSLVINMGTLNSRTIESMIAAGKKANSRGIPVIIDPVGVGATPLRLQTAEMLLREIKPAVIRGNMSEIKVLSGLDVAIKGVDSVADASGGEAIAQSFAKERRCVVAITGKTDIISDGTRLCQIGNGHEMLAQVTGTGCMTTSLVGTYCGATNDYFLGAVAGVMTMGLAGELAQQTLTGTEGIGSFRIKLFDYIYNISATHIQKGGKMHCE
jgi:hydroxyethylthiazole kinase